MSMTQSPKKSSSVVVNKTDSDDDNKKEKDKDKQIEETKVDIINEITKPVVTDAIAAPTTDVVVLEDQTATKTKAVEADPVVKEPSTDLVVSKEQTVIKTEAVDADPVVEEASDDKKEDDLSVTNVVTKEISVDKRDDISVTDPIINKKEAIVSPVHEQKPQKDYSNFRVVLYKQPYKLVLGSKIRSFTEIVSTCKYYGSKAINGVKSFCCKYIPIIKNKTISFVGSMYSATKSLFWYICNKLKQAIIAIVRFFASLPYCKWLSCFFMVIYTIMNFIISIIKSILGVIYIITDPMFEKIVPTDCKILIRFLLTVPSIFFNVCRGVYNGTLKKEDDSNTDNTKSDSDKSVV